MRVTLADRREVAPNYHVLTFDLPKDEPKIAARPGHFAMVHGANWGGSPLLPRPMSLLTDGSSPSILIKVVGEGTAKMACASVGEPYDLLAPLGKPFADLEAGKRPVLVAGGVGVVPLVYLAREMAKAGVRPIVLYGGRTKNDLPLDDALAEVADIRITTEDGSRGTKGRVTAILEQLFAESTTSLVAYTCGPNPMMAAVTALCEKSGVPVIASLEAPMACGYGVCLGCNVPSRDGGYLYVCTTGPCVDATKIDWTKMGRLHG